MEKTGTEELMYRIGIIDDVKSERDDIQVSILDNKEDFDIGFKGERRYYERDKK